MSGWVKLNRSVAEHWVWKEKPYSKGQAWVDIILSANHKAAKMALKGKVINLERGQQARSEITLADTWGWSRGKVRRFLKTLESDSMIVQQTSHATSIITVCNYSIYQDGLPTSDTADSTTDGTGVGTTDGQHTVHKQECNNEKKKKKTTLSSKNPTYRPDAEKTYKSKKGRNLKGIQLDWFEQFWKAFNYKDGKADAADSWLNLKVDETKFQMIMDGARREAMARPERKRNGSTPKMAQGWLTSRRFEDEGSGDTGIKNWWETGPGIEAKGKELGIEQGDDDYPTWYAKINKIGRGYEQD